ncbi:hypothetical protein IP70_07365 [alpha proteobacterium AAP38]|uniref:type II toxin-antitoxin system ParD family antitoxin n=1 Tax=Niveispirillum sp. TaxID=1917217 RepID=UPI0006B9AE5A|nr:hypothetical protein IP70_07365 [alpha proteobacterium AAP38]
MQNVERMSITLPSDMVSQIRAQVEEGRYASNSEVIRDALRLWQEREAQRLERIASVRARIAEADSDPRPSVTDADIEQHFRDRLARSLNGRADHA